MSDELRRIVTGVNEAPMRADRIRADDQALDHLVRISGEEGSVHERAGLAFVAVDNDVLIVPGRVLGRFPFQTGRESAAAAAAQVGLLHLVEDLVGTHLEERLRQRGISAEREIVFDPRRIDPWIVADQ